MTIYQHIRHPRIAARLADRPAKVADFLPRGTAINRFNTKVALIITAVVGSMWCAYAFALFDLISLPSAIRGGASAIVSWVAQTFLQLVLLSVIMVGQNVQAAAADKRSEAIFLVLKCELRVNVLDPQGCVRGILSLNIERLQCSA